MTSNSRSVTLSYDNKRFVMLRAFGAFELHELMEGLLVALLFGINLHTLRMIIICKGLLRPRGPACRCVWPGGV
jgi:hypothetical protein